METKWHKIGLGSAGSILRNLITVALFVILLSGCSKDDNDPTENFIAAQSAKASYTELNTCDTGSIFGSGTRFDIKIKYSASNNTKINKLLFETVWSNGKGSAKETTNFTDSGSEIVHSYCFSLGDKDWVEVTYNLVSVEGTTSNSSVVRINKPEGAN